MIIRFQGFQGQAVVIQGFQGFQGPADTLRMMLALYDARCRSLTSNLHC